MGLFDKIFGGSKSSTNPSTVWGGQAPFLQGLYQRAYNASLGQGTGWGGAGIGGQQPSAVLGRNGYQPGYARNSIVQGGRANTQPAPGQPGQQGIFPGEGIGQAWNGPGGGDPLSALGGSLTGQGLGMLGQLGMLGAGGGPFGNQLQMYSQAGNPFAQAQIGQLGQGLGRLFQQQIVPGITSTFAGAGQLGGDRQALALGQAGEGLGQSFTSGALDILGNSANLGLQAAGMGYGTQLGANQAGLGNMGNIFNMGTAGLFGSLPGLASLLGGPTVLGGGGSSSATPGILGALSGFVPKG